MRKDTNQEFPLLVLNLSHNIHKDIHKNKAHKKVDKPQSNATFSGS